MANRTTVAVLTGLLVGALMGAGAVQYAELTANMLVARVDYMKRFPRDNGLIDQNPGVPDARMQGSTAETRTEKAPAFHGAAFEDIKGRCPVENTQCFVNEINKFLREQANQ